MTAGILGAITAASFLVWSIPQANEASFVVSDHGENLDDIRSIHGAVRTEMDAEFGRLLAGQVMPDAYVESADVSTQQINSQIIRLLRSAPAGDWQESYSIYAESLRQTNSYVRETIVYARLLADGAEQHRLDEALGSAERFRSGIQGLVDASDTARP